MYDYGLSTLTQYGITAQSASRTRGALVCRTDQGLLILKQFHGSEKKLQFQQELLQKLAKEGCQVDTFLENQTGSLITKDKDNIPYTIQNWFEGRECDTKSREDIFRSVQMLAKLHKSMKMPLNLLQQSDYAALREEALKEGCVCHGAYNQHNVFFRRDGTAAANFGHFCFDIQISDLYCFMRKILEKYSWDVILARQMLEKYHQIHPISRAQWQNLMIRFTYPEKYWKLANYYFSHNKAWISGKNTEKLTKVIAQKEIWGDFPEKCFGKYPF